MNFGNGGQTYDERNSNPINLGEELFIEWAKEKCSFFTRLGFDEKNSNVDFFFKLNPLLRNLPDFLIIQNNKIFLVNVKGTGNIKKKEIDILPKIVEAYASDDVPLVYAFCFRNTYPIFINTQRLIELFEEAADKSWDDGVVYRTINITHNSKK